MKKYLIIVLLGLTACSSLKINKKSANGSIAKYQPLKKFNNDTLLFVKSSIIDRKDFYSNKELSFLIKDLQLPIRKYHNSSKSNNRHITPGIYLYINTFEDEERKRNSKIDPIIIYVKFREPLPKDQTDNLLIKSQLNWTPEVAAYYGKQIVGDVGIVQYNFK